MTRNRKQLFKQLNAILTPLTIYSFKLVKCFSSVWYVTPLLLLGAILVLCGLFGPVDDEIYHKQPGYACPFYAIGASACLMTAFSGFYKSHEPPPLGDVRDIVPAHHHVHQKRPAKCVHFTLLFCLLLPWRPWEQYGASSPQMAASSGLWCSPGHAASGNAACIASTPPHGHQNGLRRRCICSLPSPFLLGVIVDKVHVMVH